MIGKNNADHGTHEEEQQREKPVGGIVLGQIIVGIEDDQQADPQDQQDKQDGQSVHPQDESETGLRQPGISDRHRSPMEGGNDRPERQQQGRSRHSRRGPCRCPAAQRSHAERQQGPGKGKQNDEQQIHSLVNRLRMVTYAHSSR